MWVAGKEIERTDPEGIRLHILLVHSTHSGWAQPLSHGSRHSNKVHSERAMPALCPKDSETSGGGRGPRG